jgi:hypothetical protein
MSNTNCLANIKCPDCGNEDSFRIAAKTIATVTDDGTDDHGDMEWDDDSYAECTGCPRHGTLKDFQITTQPTPNIGRNPTIPNTARHLPAHWEATPYGTKWGFAYNLANIEREEYDFTVEFHESIDRREEKAVICLIEAAPVMLEALKYAESQLSEFKADALEKLELDIALNEIQNAIAKTKAA